MTIMGDRVNLASLPKSKLNAGVLLGEKNKALTAGDWRGRFVVTIARNDCLPDSGALVERFDAGRTVFVPAGHQN